MRPRAWLLAGCLTVLFRLTALAGTADGELCRAAISQMERSAFIPDRLMQSVAIMESGRRGPDGATLPWPWTINVEGVGQVFDTKAQAIAAVEAHRARGARSIDVGCMQVNLMHHAAAFPSLDQAFEPASNVRYAASFLQQLLAQTGSWPRAVAGYHSLTPEIGGEYAKKVLAIWARPEPGRAPQPARRPAAPTVEAAAPAHTQGAIAAMPGGVPARMLPMPGSAQTMFSGRGLDSYRTMPTRLVANVMLRR